MTFKNHHLGHVARCVRKFRGIKHGAQGVREGNQGLGWLINVLKRTCIFSSMLTRCYSLDTHRGGKRPEECSK